MNTRRTESILKNDAFLAHLDRIKQHEKGRKFCKHNIQHFFDVARIAYILNLDEGLGIDAELVYAAGLLHDIGRWCEYEDGTPHEQASCTLCVPILKTAQFSDAEIDQICEAIGLHRTRAVMGRNDLVGILYRADKLSRNCGFCKANQKCNRTRKKENPHVL